MAYVIGAREAVPDSDINHGLGAFAEAIAAHCRNPCSFFCKSGWIEKGRVRHGAIRDNCAGIMIQLESIVEYSPVCLLTRPTSFSHRLPLVSSRREVPRHGEYPHRRFGCTSSGVLYGRVPRVRCKMDQGWVLYKVLRDEM